MHQQRLISIFIILFTTTLVACEHSTVTAQGEVMQDDNKLSADSMDESTVDNEPELKLPVDRPLSYEEALSLRASNISLMNEDYEKLGLLEQYAKDPNETNAQYVWAVYQTWHQEEHEIESLGFQNIYKLAKLGHPYACADVYFWSIRYSDEFFKDDLEINKKEVLKIQNFCLEKALEINANEIKQVYIEDFLSNYGDDEDYDKLHPELMQNADKVRINKVKKYLLDYLFYWTNDFYGDVPSNNLADTDKAYQYLQILAYDPYGFDAVEACAWLKYFKEDILTFIQDNQLAALSTRKDSLNSTMGVIERKLNEKKFDQEQCQDRYLEIRDTPRDSNAKSRNFY